MKFKVMWLVVALLLFSNYVEAAVNVSCSDTIKVLHKENAKSFNVVCPVNCSSGTVWGTDVYTTDSPICVAAVHAGAIGANGGMVKVKLSPGKQDYTASTRNGITTSKWGAFSKSFSVSK